MALRRDELPVQLQNIRAYVGNANWADPKHDWAKAYICTLFSGLAYAVIPQSELTRVGHATIVPCDLYQRLLLERRALTVEDIRGPLEFEQAFQVVGTMLLILAVKTKNLIFVAVRGTSDMYDAITDVKFLRRRGHEDVKWHRGFYGLTLKHIDELTEKMAQIRRPGDIVIVTGHSLGGAVAGILHAIWNKPVPDSGFVFGAPRYASKIAASRIRWPFQHFHSWDFVRYLPSKSMGYTDIPISYQTNAGADGGYSDSTAFLQWGVYRLSGWKFPRTHYWENYRRDIGLRLGFDDETGPW
jgi:hypothetical protein